MKSRTVAFAALVLVTALLLVPAVAPRGALADAGWTNTGGITQYDVHSLAYDPINNRLYAGTVDNGVWKYDGTTWTPTGGAVSGYKIYSLAYDPINNRLYAGTVDNGVWKYDGANWTDTGGGVSGFFIYSLLYSPGHDLLYAGTVDHGVWKYDGANWADTGGGVPDSVHSLAYDPGDDLLYAGTVGYGVWKYDGANWADTGGGAPNQIWSLAYDPGRDLLYKGTEAGVWKYDGANWADTGGAVSGYYIPSLAYDPVNNRLYAGPSWHGVWVYDGANWADTGGAVSGNYVRSLAYDPVKDRLYAGCSEWQYGRIKERGVWYYSPEALGAPSLYPTWYLAEGSTAWGFDQYISILNPNAEACTARITYMTSTGPASPPGVTLPPTSQTTVNPRDFLGAQDFSTKVECTDGKTITADRTMIWTGPGAESEEGHCSVGVTSPSDTWYLAEGSSAWGFECWLLIQNPNSTEATCTVTYMIEGENPKTVTKHVPASSRATFDMADDIGEADASIKVASDVPVIPERAMYRNSRREGHDSIGTTSPASDYYLAEGTTAWGFTTYVLVQNPQDSATEVTVTYMTPDGAVYQTPFSMPANSRKTIRVNDILPNTDLSTRVHGSQPIIAERAMYWGADTPLGEACHDSIGMAEPHTTFYLPDGETSEGRETWTLVQNPNSSSVAVEVSYLTSSGSGNVIFYDNVPANSRKTYNMADRGVSGRAAVMVRSLDPDQKIMVERAMYWNSRGAGTDTIGGYSD